MANKYQTQLYMENKYFKMHTDNQMFNINKGSDKRKIYAPWGADIR